MLHDDDVIIPCDIHSYYGANKTTFYNKLVYTGSDNFMHCIREGYSLTTGIAGRDKNATALFSRKKV